MTIHSTNAYYMYDSVDLKMVVEVEESEIMQTQKDTSSTVLSVLEGTANAVTNADDDRVSDNDDLGDTSKHDTEASMSSVPVSAPDDGHTNVDQSEDLLNGLADLFNEVMQNNSAVNLPSQVQAEMSPDVLSKLRHKIKLTTDMTKSITRLRLAKLWMQYMDMVNIVHKFLRAERTGNWDLHIQAMHDMLLYLATSGHNHLHLPSEHGKITGSTSRSL